MRLSAHVPGALQPQAALSSEPQKVQSNEKLAVYYTYFVLRVA
jgi:hypothetical protein